MNHSCDPNLIAEFSQNSIALYAIKNIKRGDQVKNIFVLKYNMKYNIYLF